jgi:hypothetical protein
MGRWELTMSTTEKPSQHRQHCEGAQDVYTCDSAGNVYRQTNAPPVITQEQAAGDTAIVMIRATALKSGVIVRNVGQSSPR